NEIRTFASGTAALEHLLSEQVRNAGPLLVLLDLNPPDMNGVHILAKLKNDEKLKRAPVVVLTTTDDQREIQRCYDLGANVYITKPVNYDLVSNAIKQRGLFLVAIQVPHSQ